MSKEAEAIILIGSALDISAQVPHATRIRLGSYLLSMRGRYGDELKPDNKTVKAEYLNNMFAAEALMQLGSLVTNRFLDGLGPHQQAENHYRLAAINAIDDINPLAERLTVPEEEMDLPPDRPEDTDPFIHKHTGGPVATPPNAHEGLCYAREALLQLVDGMEPQALRLEMNRKTGAALAILRSHGTVTVPSDRSLEDLSTDMLHRVTPEKVHHKGDITLKVYDSITETGALDYRQRELPYYASLNETNGKELFSSALEDLYEISHALKAMG